jgi:tRNA(fMet)-specific endonuclease VapC
MKPRYLLDTNILSEVLKPIPSASVIAQINMHSRELATASSVVHEISFGCLDSRKRIEIQRYLNEVILRELPIFNYDTDAALWHSEQRARLTAQGKSPAFVDGQIASVAYVNNLILITRNIDDFSVFDGLSVNNWFEC